MKPTMLSRVTQRQRCIHTCTRCKRSMAYTHFHIEHSPTPRDTLRVYVTPHCKFCWSIVKRAANRKKHKRYYDSLGGQRTRAALMASPAWKERHRQHSATYRARKKLRDLPIGD